MNDMILQLRYDEWHAEATERVGGLLDIPRRVRLLHQVYVDSQGNHTFPLMATSAKHARIVSRDDTSRDRDAGRRGAVGSCRGAWELRTNSPKLFWMDIDKTQRGPASLRRN